MFNSRNKMYSEADSILTNGLSRTLDERIVIACFSFSFRPHLLIVQINCKGFFQMYGNNYKISKYL